MTDHPNNVTGMTYTQVMEYVAQNNLRLGQEYLNGRPLPGERESPKVWNDSLYLELVGPSLENSKVKMAYGTFNGKYIEHSV